MTNLPTRTYSLSTRYIQTGIIMMLLAIVPLVICRQQVATLNYETRVFSEAAGMYLERPWEFHEDTHYRLAAVVANAGATALVGVPGMLVIAIATVVKIVRRKAPPRNQQPEFVDWWVPQLLLIGISLFVILSAVSISRNPRLLTTMEIDQERDAIRRLIAEKQVAETSPEPATQPE